MFEHVARVLHMVDSKGTDWLYKLQKVKDEEKQYKKSINMLWKKYVNELEYFLCMWNIK